MKALNLLLSSKGYPVKDKAAALIGMKMQGGSEWPITTLTGSLPLTYESRTEHILKNYALYGSASGAGVETENLWNLPQNKSATTFNDVVWSINNYAIQGAGTTSSPQGTDAILVRPGGTISRATNYAMLYEIKAWDGLQLPTGTYHAHGTALDEAYVYLIVGVVGSREYAGGAARRITLNSDFVVNEDEYVVLLFSTSTAVATYGLSDFMITKIGSAPTTYIPFGYKIPLTNTGENSQSETYPLYIGSTKLGEEEYLDYEEQKIYRKMNGTIVGNRHLDTNSGLPVAFSGRCCITSPLSVPNDYYSVYYSDTNDNNIHLMYSLFNDTTLVRRRAIENGKYMSSGYTIDCTGGNKLYLGWFDPTQVASVTPADVTNIFLTTPTDPPVPFPAISAYKGENTLSSTETVGECSVTGRIKPIET